MALSNEQWRWIMRRDNEHCEVIIQDKLVEYQRTHTLEIAPVHTASW